MRLGLGLNITANSRRGGTPAFSPTSLYSSGAQGIWLDPSDLSTMFSDRAGTVPITTPGTVVGKRLDKSGRGNHATAPTDAARPVYGVEPKGGRRNLLTWSEGFDNAAWMFTGTSRTQNYGTAPDGTQTSCRLVFSAANNDLRQTATVGGVGTTSVWVKGTAGQTVAFINNLTDALQYVTFTGSWQQASRTGPTSAAALWLIGTWGTATARDFEIWHPQLELGSPATAYQRVTNNYDVTESGVATCHYVQYDGSDDSMSTSAIDFTATDKMSVFAGVRRLTNSAASIVLESSANVASNSGSFWIVSGDATYQYSALSRGSAAVGSSIDAKITSASFNPPSSDVVTSLHDIAGDSTSIRGDGVLQATATGDQGTGNYGNYPLFIGRRNNATLPFNGKDYGLIVVGKAASATEISNTELWLSDKTAEVDVAKSISPNIYTRSGDTILDRANSIIERRTV